MKCDACKLKPKCDDLERAGILPKIKDCRAFTPLPTNADRIRAMTDEELARFLLDMCPEDVNFYCRLSESCLDCWRLWLKREAAEPPKDYPAPICQTCGNVETCPWQDDPNIAEHRQTTEGRVVACSDYKDKKG